MSRSSYLTRGLQCHPPPQYRGTARLDGDAGRQLLGNCRLPTVLPNRGLRISLILLSWPVGTPLAFMGCN